MTAYSLELADEICKHVGNGMSDAKICDLKGMPDRKLLWVWLGKYPAFKTMYDEAILRSGVKRTPFVKGHKLSKGRPKGSRHIITESFLKALARDFNKLDEAGKVKQGAAAIAKVRETDPASYMRIVASLQPKDFNVNINPLETAADDDLREQLSFVEAAIRELIGGTITIENGIAAEAEHPQTPALPALH